MKKSIWNYFNEWEEIGKHKHSEYTKKESNKHRLTLSAYGNMGGGKTLNTSEKKENYGMVMVVCMNAVKILH